MKKIILPLAAGIVLASCSLSKRMSGKGNSPVSQQTLTKADTLKKDTTKKIKPYGEVITSKAITQNGLCKVHKVDDRWFFELPDSILNKDILIVNRVSKAAAGFKPDMGREGYAGEWIGENVIQIEKGPDQKIFLKHISYLDISKDSSENGMYRSIYNSSLEPIVASFDIKAYSPDSAGVVIDMTDYIKSDNDILFFRPIVKEIYELGGLLADRSYIANIHSFPLNTEIRTVRTYTSINKLLASSGNQVVTYELNSSLILLPAKPMKSRRYDDRVGYFARGYRSFDAKEGVSADYKITRWRLEPRKEDIEKYKRGELVEPEKPIIFYIDPATPKKWVPYLAQGVKDWQKAFEKAGFKNAIYALEAPTNDPSWSLEDARHNAIVYMASDFPNAMGPHVSDPRTGEILESHIHWYHNVLQLLHDWYMLQAGPNDPRARKMEFDDSLLGQLIRFVCAHEVGHTLGLQHNFRASASIPVDSLRSRHYVTVNGLTPSIMDYARFNYVAQPEDSIDAKDLVPRIGVYDEWAIEWGYRWLPGFNTPEEEKSWLNSWVSQKQEKDKRLLFSDGRIPDSWLRTEDLGDDAVKAGNYGIKNLQRVTAHIREWTKTPNANYDALSRMYRAVVMQYSNYLTHVLMDIGGIYRTPKTVEQSEPVYSFPSKEKQRASVQFLQEQLFNTPAWIDNKELYPLVGVSGDIWIYKLQEFYLTMLIEPLRWQNMFLNENNLPKDKSYSFYQMLTDMETGIWKELKDHKAIELNRRNLQKIYVTKLSRFLELHKAWDWGMLDACTEVENHLHSIYNRIDKALPGYKDQVSLTHLQDLHNRLKKILDYQKSNYPNPSAEKNNKAFNVQSVNKLSNDLFLFDIQQYNKGCWLEQPFPGDL